METTNHITAATSFVAGVAKTKMSTAASLTFLLYDYVINFEAERNFVWDRRWSFGKILFIFNRYFGITALLFNTIVMFSGSLSNEIYLRYLAINLEELRSCKHFIWWEAASQIIAVTSAAIILQARIYAVYDRSRKILFAMVTLSLSAIVSSLSLVYIQLPDGFAQVPMNQTGCYIIVPRLLFLCWIPGLVAETILCLLMLYKAVLEYREDPPLTMLQLIVRDSFFYFLTIFSVLLANVLIWILGDPPNAELALGWEIAVPCAVGGRLFISMRERYYQGQASLSGSLGLGGESYGRSQIRFHRNVTFQTMDDGVRDYISVSREVVQ